MSLDPKLITGLQNISYAHSDESARRTLGEAIATLERLEAELKSSDDLNAGYQMALHEIMKPVEAMLNRNPQGSVFDGDMAFRIARDPNYLMGIARKALAEGGLGTK